MTTRHEDKRAENSRKHDVDLADAAAFEWDAALIAEDRTEAYGELRFRAIGPIGPRLYVYVFTFNDDDTDHAISLRRAEPREGRFYVSNI